MNKKGFLIAIIIVLFLLGGSIALFIAYKVNTNKKVANSIQDLSKINIKALLDNNKKGDFPEEMKDFLSTSSADLLDYAFSHPNDLRDKSRLSRHYEGVLLYKNYDLNKYKKNLLPKIKKLVGKYTKPECFDNTNNSAQENNLPFSPDLKQFQNTLIEWCLIANCFEEKDDGNSAFLLSYGAARMSIKLLSDYADGASEENLRVANNILRCACCQLIYIANSGLKHNRNMVRFMVKDLYTISQEYPPLSRTINYELKRYDNIIEKIAKQENYALSTILNSKEGKKALSEEIRKLFTPLLHFCDAPYYENIKTFENWYEELKLKSKEAINKLDTSNMPKLVSYALINNNLSDYNKCKIFTEETRVIIDGAATVLATYEYISRFSGSFKYSPSLIAKDSKSTIPESRLSGVPISIKLPFSYEMTEKDDKVVFFDDHQILWQVDKYQRMKTNQVDNNYGITFLTRNEFILQSLREEYKSEYFDLDEAISKMTPEEKERYEKAKIENEKNELEAKKSVEKMLEQYRKDDVEVESINDFFCGYKLGEKVKNLKESNYKESDLGGLEFHVRSKKPFLGEFSLGSVQVDEKTKKVTMICFKKSYDRLSERELAIYKIQKNIEGIEGIKQLKHDNTYDNEKFQYIQEEEKYKIYISLLKGLDGGGTLSILTSKL